MSEQIVAPAPATTIESESEAVPEPSGTTRVVLTCECGTPPAVVMAADRPSGAGPSPSRAPHRVFARVFARLPLWVRVASGVALWALVYHYWLPVATWLTRDVLKLNEGRLASSFEFFIYDTVKVLLLLTIVVFGVGMVRSFFSPQRTRALLHGRREATAVQQSARALWAEERAHHADAEDDDGEQEHHLDRVVDEELDGRGQAPDAEVQHVQREPRRHRQPEVVDQRPSGDAGRATRSQSGRRANRRARTLCGAREGAGVGASGEGSPASTTAGDVPQSHAGIPGPACGISSVTRLAFSIVCWLIRLPTVPDSRTVASGS